MQLRRLFILFTTLCCFHVAKSQILDDSTKLVYGPSTVNYIHERDLYLMTDQVNYPDTTIKNFHWFTEVEQREYTYQNLGNYGTALSSIYYHAPAQIGISSGYYVYDYWFTAPDEIRYYNTKSPYTRLNYFLAGNGRSKVDVTHSRNIKPNWNVGFDFRRAQANKQIGLPLRRDDRQVTSTAYDFFTYYKTKDQKYQLMANFSRFKHMVNESGGISVPAQSVTEEITDIIEYNDSPIRLRNAESDELRVNYHLYHQYAIDKGLQFYHIFDKQHKVNQYTDNPLSGDIAYYQQVLISTDSTTERLKHVLWQNQIGVKGELGPLYYNGYLKRRDNTFLPKYLPGEEINENFIGGNARFQLDSLITLYGNVEYLLGGEYSLLGGINMKWLNATYRRVKCKVPYIYNTYFGNHNEWYNDFESPVANELEAKLILNFGKISLQPGLQASVVQRPIYFTTDELTLTGRPTNVRPVQAGASAQILSPFIYAKFLLGEHWHLDNHVMFTEVTGESSSAFNMPAWLVNSSFYFEGNMFGGNLYGQLGLDAHWKSAYKANAYDPVTQQFLVQEEFEVPAYPIIDLFFAFRINRTRLFMRMSHLNQGFPDNGYFVTPYYSGTKRTFDLGIDWLFFD